MKKIEKWLSTIIDNTPNDSELGSKIRNIYLVEKNKPKEEEVDWEEVLNVGGDELKEWYDKLPKDQKSLLDELWN
tara:strand:- start:286 stop:510 length:225 start_codon:yes stop_codon:yes gene_type:complete